MYQVTIPIASGLTAIGTAVGSSSLTTTANAISAFAMATNLPGMQLATSGVNRYGYGPIEQKPFMPLFSTCDMRILADNDGQVFTFISTWLNFILNYNVSQGIGTATGFGVTGGLGGTATNSMNPYEVQYAENYWVDLTIALYSPSGTQSMATVLRNAYPKFLGDPQLAYGSMNNTLMFPVSFSFTDWFNQSSSTLGGASAINSLTSTAGVTINLSGG